MKARLGIDPGRIPHTGRICQRPGRSARRAADALLDFGFRWVSSMYPGQQPSQPMQEPDAATLDGIVASQAKAQPFVYPSGLVEVPMSPISDVGAFRNGRWTLASFLQAVRLGVEWAIEHGAAYDFLAHPSCVYVTDPKFAGVEMICQLVADAGNRAEIVDLTTLAQRAAGPTAARSS